MFYVSNYALAVFFCVVTMFCWGSWGNTQKLAGKTWRYELFYWDGGGWASLGRKVAERPYLPWRGVPSGRIPTGGSSQT